MSILASFLAYCSDPANAILPACDLVWPFAVEWARLFSQVMIT